MRRNLAASLALLPLLAIACAEPDATAESGATYVVGDSAGIRMVSNARPVDISWVVEDTPRVRIGDASGRPEYELYRVRGSLRQPDGRLVIANGGSNELRWYGAAGEFIQSVGGEGQGPGEFVTLWDLFRLGGDTIAAFDRQPRRVSVFDGSGRFVRSLQIETPSAFDAFPIARFADGAYLLRTGGVPIGTEGPARIDRYPQDTFRWVESASDAELLATYPGFEMAVVPDARRPGMFMRSTRQFGVLTSLAADAYGWIAGDGVRTQLDYWSPTGELEMLVRWTTARRVVTAEDVRADVESQVATRPDPEAQESTRRLYESHPPPPDSMPVFDWIYLDAERNLWARSYAPRAEEHPNRHQVFSPEGVWLGAVTAPPGLRILSIGADHLVGVTQDDLGVEVVSVHRLVKPGA